MDVSPLIDEIRRCKECAEFLECGPRPVVSFNAQSKILLIGQAPGRIVHQSGVPWEDKSGDTLRKWLGVDKSTFYNPAKFGIVPMGFCYPGKGTSGDLPPRKECAPLWHTRIFEELCSVQLILLIGKYAQDYYLSDRKKRNLTERVKDYGHYLPKYFPLPHPSPRNNIWQKKNPWFKQDVVPALSDRIKEILN